MISRSMLRLKSLRWRCSGSSLGGENEPVSADSRFVDAVAKIKPAAEVVLKAFQEMNTPDEIGLEFGLKFNAKTGVVFASADSEATFKGIYNK